MNVGYARVSTSSQNIENQIEQLKDTGCVKIFSEKKSGKNKADRKQFNIMVDFVREGDILFITKLDRLARSVIDLQNSTLFGAIFLLLKIVPKMRDKRLNFRTS